MARVKTTTPVAEVAPDRIRRFEIVAIAAILIVAAAIRVIYLLQYRADVPYYSTLVLGSGCYDAWAQRVAAGRGYGPSPFYMAPLYPYVVAAVYAIVGHRIGAVYVLQAGLGIVNLLLAWLIARRLFGREAGLLAALLLLFYGPLLFLESKILTETLAITLNLASLLLLIAALKRTSSWIWLVSGFVLGLSAVCRPVALITIALVLAWLVIARGKRFVRIAALVIGTAAAILPVTARNYIVGQDVVLIASNGGMVFAQGNDLSSRGLLAALPGFTGSMATQQNEETAAASRALGRPVKPSEASNYFFRRGLAFARTQPWGFLRLLGRKLIWSLHDREMPCDYSFYLERRLTPVLQVMWIPFTILASFAVFGFVRARRDGRNGATVLAALFVLSVFISLIVFMVSSRYRAPAVPLLAGFAGFGLVEMIRSAVGKRLREVATGFACLLAVGCFSLVPFPFPRVTGDALANLGASYLYQGRIREAVKYSNEALEVSPGYAYAHLNLGIAYQRRHETEQAVGHFQDALRSKPGYPEAHYHLGALLAGEGKLDAAMLEYREAIRNRSDYAEAHSGLANVLVRLGRGDEAMSEYRAAIDAEPGYADAHFNLGVLLDAKNDLNEAMKEYRAALDAKPGHVEARVNLAIDLYMTRDYAQAWREVHLARKHGGKPNPEFLKALAAKMPQPAE